MKQKPKTVAERLRKMRARYKNAGLVRVELWLLPRYVNAIKKIEAKSKHEALEQKEKT